MEGLDQKQISTYQTVVTENNINGKVLASCDLSELSHIMAMTFGDWQLFRAWILTARNPNQECTTWLVTLYIYVDLSQLFLFRELIFIFIVQYLSFASAVCYFLCLK